MKEAFERGGTGQRSLGPELGKQKYENADSGNLS